jgi:8-oxo-dGTP diphosphatase
MSETQEEQIIQFGTVKAGVDYLARICAYGVIHNESGSIAVLRTPKGYFLPGGGIHSAETPEEALVREITEETGYASIILDKIGIAAQLVYAKKKRIFYRKIGHFFAARFTLQVTASVEADHELSWHPAEDAIKKMTHEYQAWAIRQALFCRRGL